MIVKDFFENKETYTHDNWVYKDVNIGFSRLYYIVDGEAYYEENGKAVRLKKGHLYLTPVKTPFTLYENPNDKLLHTYAHVYTIPAVKKFTEIEVIEGTPLYDAVAMWRKYIGMEDRELAASLIQLVLSFVDKQRGKDNKVTLAVKKYIDGLEGVCVDMDELSRAIGYTREHITRAFSSVYRMTPMQYLTSKKMELARRSLTDGASIKETADMLGYSTPYSFSKAFKGYYGVSPKAYVKTVKWRSSAASEISTSSSTSRALPAPPAT